MALHKRHALTAVVGQPVVLHILAGIFDVAPIILQAVARQIVTHCKVEREIEHIAIAADAARVDIIDILADKLLLERAAAVKHFAE